MRHGLSEQHYSYQSKTVASIADVSHEIGAVEKTRTSTRLRNSDLNAARLPIPPRPHCEFAPNEVRRDCEEVILILAKIAAVF